jgi:hypothetical protein
MRHDCAPQDTLPNLHTCDGEVEYQTTTLALILQYESHGYTRVSLRGHRCIHLQPVLKAGQEIPGMPQIWFPGSCDENTM